VVTSGGAFTSGAFLGDDNVQIGSTTSAGVRDVLGTFTSGVIDLFTKGTLAVGPRTP
jgi:hypothetical protein